MKINLKDLKKNIINIKHIDMKSLTAEEEESIKEVIEILNDIVDDIEISDECIIEEIN